ncbi:MAG: hypothetical protein U0572_04680 [Phycisphaerales bacterium]
MLSILVALACALPQDSAPRAPTDHRPPPPTLVWPDRSAVRASTHADLASLRRLVTGYDFEDAARFPRELPPDWYRVLSSASGRPGYPAFGTVGLAEGVAHGGSWALEFDVDGGSMAVTLPPGLVRIFPGSRYRVTCWVRTEAIERAGARVVARFYGRDGKPTGDEFATSPARSEGAWLQVHIDLPEIPADVTDLALELEVAQPSLLDPLAERKVGNDVHGKVWFDDLEVWQVPVIHFATDGAGQVFLAGREPGVNIALHDLVSDRLTARVTVVDVDDSVVLATDVPIAGAGGEAHVPLGVTAPGWYRATLEVLDAEQVVVARRQLELVVISDRQEQRLHDGVPQFGVLLPAASDSELPLHRAFVDAMNPDFAVIPLWQPGFDVNRMSARIEAMRVFIDGLLDTRVEPILAIETVPARLAAERHIDQTQALAFFGTAGVSAKSLLEPWLFAFGQHVSRWQVGSLDAPAASNETAFEHALALRATLDGNVASPIVLLPIEAESDSDEVPAGLARHVRLPWAARPGAISEYVDPWKSPETIVSLELAPTDELTHRMRIDDLAHRTLDAWKDGTEKLAIELPMHAATSDASPASLLPEALAWRQLSSWLSDHSYGGAVPLGVGVTAWISDGRSSSSIVAWAAPESDAEIALALGNRPVRVTDLLGRTRTVELRGGMHRIGLTPSPVLIDGADPSLIRMLAQSRFEPTTLESRRAGQSVDLVLYNPFTTAVSGTMSIADRPDWTIQPRQQGFSIAPGGETRVPLRITLPRAAVAGPTTLSVELDFASTESYRTTLVAPLTIDWPAVEIARSWRFARSVETGHIDVVVTVSATNRSTETLDLEAFALAKGFTQNRKQILKLAPGATATRVFQFPEGGRKLSGATVHLGVNDLQGDKRLSTALQIPPLLPPVPTTAAANP